MVARIRSRIIIQAASYGAWISILSEGRDFRFRLVGFRLSPWGCASRPSCRRRLRFRLCVLGAWALFPPSSSRALARAGSPARAPPIILASSSTRSSNDRRLTEVTVRPWRTAFSIWKWVVPAAAICGRWVMQRTWNCSPSRCSFSPTTVATRPADAGIDLVEDERLARLVGGCQGLQRQHDPRQLAA